MYHSKNDQIYQNARQAGQKSVTFTETYGILLNCHGRYAIVTDINNDPNDVFYRRSYHMIDLSYKRSDFAIQKAESFIKGCHKDFVDWQGISIHFDFVNCGDITPFVNKSN
jgi:hypothetical protein